MLTRLSGEAKHCYLRADEARLTAIRAKDEKMRQTHLDIEMRWLRLARAYEMAEQISGYLEWQCQRIRHPDEQVA